MHWSNMKGSHTLLRYVFDEPVNLDTGVLDDCVYNNQRCCKAVLKYTPGTESSSAHNAKCAVWLGTPTVMMNNKKAQARQFLHSANDRGKLRVVVRSALNQNYITCPYHPSSLCTRNITIIVLQGNCLYFSRQVSFVMKNDP
jgi:hypothetical protein